MDAPAYRNSGKKEKKKRKMERRRILEARACVADDRACRGRAARACTRMNARLEDELQARV